MRTNNFWEKHYSDRFARLDGVHAIRELARLRGRRERQWQRLHPDTPFLWMPPGDESYQRCSAIRVAYQQGPFNVHGREVLDLLNCDRNQIERRRAGRG